MQAQVEQLAQDDTLRPRIGGAGRRAGATRRLSRLHQALTLLSKIENQQFTATVPLHFDQVVQDRAGQLEERAATRGLALRVAITGMPTLRMDPDLADSLVQNLLQNAIKHNHRGGHIQVLLSAAALEIANTGPAVTGDPARFFERFRKHNAASDSPGLGLSIVQQICQLYGFALRYDFAPAGAVSIPRASIAVKPSARA